MNRHSERLNEPLLPDGKLWDGNLVSVQKYDDLKKANAKRHEKSGHFSDVDWGKVPTHQSPMVWS